MKLPEDIRYWLARHFKKKHREWLVTANLDNWPLQLSLEVPTEQVAKQQPEGVRAWIAAWQSCQDAGTVVWNERHWRLLGVQRVPEKLVLHEPLDVALWVGESLRWQCAMIRYAKMVECWPSLKSLAAKYFNVLADYPEDNFLRLMSMLDWVISHPKSNLYPRQIPIPGIDTKWLDGRKGLLTELVVAIQGSLLSGGDFFQQCGLRATPQLIRLRILDVKLRSLVAGLGDITAPWEEVAALSLPVKYVFIVENLQTGLAFEEMPDTVVIMRLGYGVDILSRLPWLAYAQCFYWGDLDTHGFAILNRARLYLPKIESVLMDETTLTMHKDLWVQEETPHFAEMLPELSVTEQELYQSIKQNRWGQRIRLEQERITWSVASKALNSVISI